MNTVCIILAIIIVAMIGIALYRGGKLWGSQENYELVPVIDDFGLFQRTGGSIDFPSFTFNEKEVTWDGYGYKIPPKSWFIDKCNKIGPNAPYSDGGCDDSMKSQRSTGSCSTFWCNK